MEGSVYNPIYVSDNSPISLNESPVKPKEEGKADEYRLVQDSDSSCKSDCDISDKDSVKPTSLMESPVKLIKEKGKRHKYRRLVQDLESSCESDCEISNRVSVKPKAVCKRRLSFEEENSGSEYADVSSPDEGAVLGADIIDKSPVYEVPFGLYTGEQILKILLNPHIKQSKICHSKPTNVFQSSTFVVDLDSLDHPDDIKKDDFGKWVYSGSHAVSYAAFESSGRLEFERLSGTPCSEAGNIFQLRRINCKHPTNSECQRLLAFVTAPSGDPHRLCLLSYNIPSGFSKHVTSHGNSKQKVPFYPTNPSTKLLIQKEVLNRHVGPKQTISVVSEKVGGVMTASSPCDLPRNERQIVYLKSRSGSTGSSPHSSGQDPMADQVFTVMQQAKTEDHAGKFVRDCRPSPEPAFVLSRDWQLDDLVRFCTTAGNFSVLTVDPTFNLGDFDVTPTAYQHLLLKTVRYGTSPIFIGPTMVHYRKTFGTYLFFASSLIGLRPELTALQAFGTDGEKALADAFAHQFHYASRLSCFIHCRRNLKQQLRDRHYPEGDVKSVLDDVFGVQQDDIFAEGLVDCRSDVEFSEKLQVLEKHWNSIEENNSQIKQGFYCWFVRHKSHTIKTTMLRPVREEAGLGCPPEPFTTNPSEAVNAVIKNQVGYKSNQLMEFIWHLRTVIDEQSREVERAVINRGKYRFKEQYASLQVPESQWFKMTERQRFDHMKRVATTKVHVALNDSPFPADASTSTRTSSLDKSRVLSIDVNSVAANVSVPLECLKGIWNKAEELLNSPQGMFPAPGYPESARSVLSRSGKRPHTVVPGKNGSFKCDHECLNYKSLGICSHTVAVAEANKVLAEFIAHFEKAKKKPNFTAIALHGNPAGSGRKGGVPPKKRRKTASITTRVDRLETFGSSNSATTGGNTSQVGSASTVNISLSSQATPSYVHSNPYQSGWSSYWGFLPPQASGVPYAATYTTPTTHTTPTSFTPPTYVAPNPPTVYTHSSNPVSPAGVQHPPMAQDNAPFNLHFISGNISKCAGCGNKYIKPPVPPFDICIQHKEWRSFSLGGIQQSKFAPSYYHVNEACIKRKWPMFTPEQLFIPPDIFLKLSATHTQYLQFYHFMS